eukprot:jgi/Mesen1/9275/ME000060S08714
MASGFEQVLQLVESACNEAQIPEKQSEVEATLLAFRKSPQALPASRYILENSKNAVACFHAAAVLQEAALIAWPHLQPSDCSALLQYCVHFIMTKVGSGEAFVRSKMVAVLALLLKRSWLDEDASLRDSLMAQVEGAARGGAGQAAQAAALSILRALVAEMSPSTASPLSLPREFHDRCALSMESGCLLRYYEAAMSAAAPLMAAAVTGGGVADTSSGAAAAAAVVAPAVHLMSLILSWDFRPPSSSSSSAPRRAHAHGAGASAAADGMLQPGREWAAVLAGEEALQWLLSAYSALRHHGQSLPPPANTAWVDSALATGMRQLAVRLCALSGPVFPPEAEGAAEAHARRLLEGVASWLSPPHAVVAAVAAGGPASEVQDACRALHTLALHAPLAVFTSPLSQYVHSLPLHPFPFRFLAASLSLWWWSQAWKQHEVWWSLRLSVTKSRAGHGFF